MPCEQLSALAAAEDDDIEVFGLRHDDTNPTASSLISALAAGRSLLSRDWFRGLLGFGYTQAEFRKEKSPACGDGSGSEPVVDQVLPARILSARL